MASRRDCDDDRRLSLLVEAARLATSVLAAEVALEQARTRRADLMKRMNEAGMPWAEIAAEFGMTAPAAMYATGHVKRRRKAADED